MKKTLEKGELNEPKAQKKIKEMLGEIKKISYNFRSQIDAFIKEYVK